MTAVYISSFEAILICDKARKKIAELETPGAEHFANTEYDAEDIKEAIKSIEDQYNDARKLGVTDNNIIIFISSYYQTLLAKVLAKH